MSRIGKVGVIKEIQSLKADQLPGFMRDKMDGLINYGWRYYGKTCATTELVISADVSYWHM